MRRTQRLNSDSLWKRQYGGYQKNNYEHRQVTNYNDKNNNRKRSNKNDKRPYEHDESDHQLHYQDLGNYDNDRDYDGGYNYGNNEYFEEDENDNEDGCFNDGEYVREFFSNNFRRRSECEGKDTVDEQRLYYDDDNGDCYDRNSDKSNTNNFDNNNYEYYTSTINNMRDWQDEISDQYYQRPREITFRVGNERSLSTSSKRIVIQNYSSVPVGNDDFLGMISPLRNDDSSGRIVPLRNDDSPGKISPLSNNDSSGKISPLSNNDSSDKKNVLKELGISLDDVKRFLNDDIVESSDEAVLKSSFIKMLREKVLDRDVVDEECEKIDENDEATSTTKELSKKETRRFSYDGKGHNGRTDSVKYSLKTSNTTSRHIPHSRDSKKEDHQSHSQRSKRSRSRSPRISYHYDRRETNSKHHSTLRRRSYSDEKRLPTKRYSREISSSDLKDSSIADFLKAAAESSLKETKKQQASRFIFNQFKIAQPLNFTQNLPVISQVYATSPTTHFPIISSRTVMIPHSPIMPQFCQLQASLTTSSSASNLSSVYQSTSLPSGYNNIKMTDTEYEEKLSNSSELKTSIDDELKLIRRSTNFIKTLPQSDENVDDKIESEGNDVTITRVFESKHKSTKRLLPFVRKVMLSTDRKNASNEDQKVFKTKARVPSWFNSRCIELFKKRHKKVQQLKQAQKDNCDSEESIKEALREIDREYIPLCKKTKSEYIQSSANNQKKESKSDPIESKIVF